MRWSISSHRGVIDPSRWMGNPTTTPIACCSWITVRSALSKCLIESTWKYLYPEIPANEFRIPGYIRSGTLLSIESKGSTKFFVLSERAIPTLLDYFTWSSRWKSIKILDLLVPTSRARIGRFQARLCETASRNASRETSFITLIMQLCDANKTSISVLHRIITCC